MFLGSMSDGEVMGRVNDSPDKTTQKDEESGILKIVKEPWFIATVGILVWLVLLAIVIYICCRRRKKKSRGSTLDEYKSTRGEFVLLLYCFPLLTQQINTWWKSEIKTLEKSVDYVQS